MGASWFRFFELLALASPTARRLSVDFDGFFLLMAFPLGVLSGRIGAFDLSLWLRCFRGNESICFRDSSKLLSLDVFSKSFLLVCRCFVLGILATPFKLFRRLFAILLAGSKRSGSCVDLAARNLLVTRLSSSWIPLLRANYPSITSGQQNMCSSRKNIPSATASHLGQNRVYV